MGYREKVEEAPLLPSLWGGWQSPWFVSISSFTCCAGVTQLFSELLGGNSAVWSCTMGMSVGGRQFTQVTIWTGTPSGLFLQVFSAPLGSRQRTGRTGRSPCSRCPGPRGCFLCPETPALPEPSIFRWFSWKFDLNQS